VVIGGGFIGLEVAATLAELGKRVTVIEAGDRLLGRVVAPSISDYIERSQLALGVSIATRSGVERIEGTSGKVRGVVTAAGERIAADLVLVGIGAEARSDVAMRAGIACANGIVVDSFLATDCEKAFAIGDCALYPHQHARRSMRLESVQNANDHARHVAKSILGRKADYAEIPWFWSDQGSMRLQMAGLAIGADRQVLSGSTEDDNFSVYHFSGEQLVCIESVNRPGEHMLGRKMLSSNFSPSDQLVAAGPAETKAAFMEWQGTGRR
jgi:3-phenylpropionate/trans-cinnamate dioxygenase ferredoxin reductase subunit